MARTKPASSVWSWASLRVAVGQLVQVACGAIGRRVHLPPAPGEFRRVPFRRVGREAFNVPTRALGDELRHARGAMRGQSAPHDHDGASKLSQQSPQEVDRLRSFDRLAMQPPRKPQPTPTRADGDRSDRREAPVRTEPMAQDRREAGRGPGATQQRTLQNAGFVDENQVGVQPRRFFLMRGQSRRTQFSIASSSRSIARRAGFCGVKPKLRNNRGR